MTSKHIVLTKISPNPDQPRKTFPQEHIARLAASIDQHGLIQPITVRPLKRGRYMIVAGECRYRAHVLLKRKTIRCEIVEVDDDEMQLRAIIENLQRHDMNPIEEARAFKRLLDAGRSLEQIVADLNCGRALIENRLKLLDLTAQVQGLVATAAITPTMGTIIAWVPAAQQSRLVRAISTGKLRTVEHVRHAAIALRDALDQPDAFASARRASSKEVAKISQLEAKIAAIVDMVAAGFKNGECVAAQRVSPDRVKLMADKLALIRKHVLAMEHDLRRVATQTEMTLETSR